MKTIFRSRIVTGLSIMLNLVLASVLLMRFDSRDGAIVPHNKAQLPVLQTGNLREGGIQKSSSPSLERDSTRTHNTLVVPREYLGSLPNYLVNLDEDIDEFYAAKLGLNTDEIKLVKDALSEYKGQLKILQKARSRLVTAENGDSYLVIDGVTAEQSSLLASLRSNFNGLDPGKASLIEYLITTSPVVARQTERMELAFTEVNGDPVLSIIRQAPGAASSTETIPLNGSPQQRASLSARFGHLINTDESIAEMQTSISASKARWEENNSIIRSIFVPERPTGVP